VLYLARPGRCLGAFRRGPADYRLDMDNTQLSLSALVRLHRLLDGKKRK
jgi:hypothetical protein